MAGSAWGRIADWFIPGNAYNSTTGRWNPYTLKTGIAGLVAGQAVPGGEAIVSGLAKGGVFGSDWAKGLRNEGIYNTMADQYADWREQAMQDVKNGLQPNSVTVGQPQPVTGFLGSFAGTQPTGGNNQPAWEGLGTSTGNVFNGGSLGSWANGSSGGRAPGAAEFAMGGASQGGGHGSMWTGVSGDAARGFFAGMRNSSNEAAKEELAAAMRRMQQ